MILRESVLVFVFLMIGWLVSLMFVFKEKGFFCSDFKIFLVVFVVFICGII